MRVLVCAGAGFGHLVPLLPLALAFRAGGAEVLVATVAEEIAAMPSPAEVASRLARVATRA